MQLESRDSALFKYFKPTSSSPQTLTIEKRETVSEFVKKAEEEVQRKHVTHQKYAPIIVLKMVRSCQSLLLVLYFSKESSRKHCKKACVMHQYYVCGHALPELASHGINP